MAGIVGEGWRSQLQSAIDGIYGLQSSFPGDMALISAERQLLYLIALADNIELDDRALEEITIGHIAMYQLSGLISNDFSIQLCDISDRVRRYLRQHGRQMKIDQR